MLRLCPVAFCRRGQRCAQWVCEREKGGRTTPGKIFLSFSAAHAALGFPPFRQSSKSNSGWRTGFENDTRAESTSVIVRTPQPCERQEVSRTHSAQAHTETYHECAGDVAPERARAEEQAARVRDLVEVERGHDAPPHQLQVEVDGLIRQSVHR